MATDAVQGAVSELRSLAEKLKSGERYFDVDGLVDAVDQSILGLSHLRAGAGQVQTNLEELEQKVKTELVQGIGARMITGESAMQNMMNNMAMMEQKMNAVETMITGMSGTGWSFGSGGRGGGKDRGVLEFKAIQFLKPLGGDKSMFRQWHQTLVSAMYTVKDEYGDILKAIATELDTGAKVDDMRDKLDETFDSEDLDDITRKLYTIIMDKSEGEAFDKMKGVQERDGLEGYGRIYQWFTEISGLGLAEQARRLMHPDPPKKEEDLAEYVDLWCERVRRLEAHGVKYILPPLYKFTALRMMMTGKAADHFEMWQAETDDDEKGFGRLLDKVRDYARRRKLDDVAKKAVSGGRDMDCGGVHKGCGGHQAQQTGGVPAGGEQQAQGAGGQDWSWWGARHRRSRQRQGQGEEWIPRQLLQLWGVWTFL